MSRRPSRSEATTISKSGPSGSHAVNYLNVGLILLSFAIAQYIPFKLFLFAYAILGPGHYLTEISWLQKRNFFTKGRHDGWVLTGFAAVLCVLAIFRFASLEEHKRAIDAMLMMVAFGTGLVFLLTAKTSTRIAGVAGVLVISWIAVNTGMFITIAVAIFLPTLIHVYIFTGFFMIYGALKEKSVSGYFTFACFLIFPLLYFVTPAPGFELNKYVVESYWHGFAALNSTILGVAVPHNQAQLDEAVRQVFMTDAGLVVMRFIAFAYTYHYLNWFSKTTVIKWHKAPARRMWLVGVLWVAAIVPYAYDYAIGIKVLFCLSALHVFLEFPLNSMSILGVMREIPLFRLRPLAAAKRVSETA